MGVIEKIEKIIPQDGSKKIVVWGCGNVGVHAIYLILKSKREIAYIVDNNVSKQGTFISGIEIRNPAEILYEDVNNTLVFVCTGDMVAREVGKELEKMGYQYNKNYFTVLSIDRYAPTDKIDFMLGYSRGISQYKFVGGGVDKKDFKHILTLGGSTTDYSFYGIQSWPYFLGQKLLLEGKNYRVLNGGVIGYTSNQEMLSLLRDGLSILRPGDIVISYSGVNENAVEEYRYSSSYYVRVMNQMRDSYLKESHELNEFYYGEKVEDFVENYIRNMRIMHGLCEEFGIKFISVLQPTIFTGKYKKDWIDQESLENSVLKERINNSSIFYNTVQEKIAEYLYIYDFTHLFDDCTECFYDWCHCNEKGNKIIAESMYNLLNKIGV